ncbi:chascon isoform d-related [Anaeramoeba flamelloides]|uniref:Chascon isoform d-related n=1 Tax=Anaeramoeba flamelloides TaxID=1746091 RepID=A0AAV7ZHH7_9EUKA|nr:chascon isoform d-related [Anaeramoeba flamelloides]
MENKHCRRCQENENLFTFYNCNQTENKKYLIQDCSLICSECKKIETLGFSLNDNFLQCFYSLDPQAVDSKANHRTEYFHEMEKLKSFCHFSSKNERKRNYNELLDQKNNKKELEKEKQTKKKIKKDDQINSDPTSEKVEGKEMKNKEKEELLKQVKIDKKEKEKQKEKQKQKEQEQEQEQEKEKQKQKEQEKEQKKKETENLIEKLKRDSQKSLNKIEKLEHLLQTSKAQVTLQKQKYHKICQTKKVPKEKKSKLKKEILKRNQDIETIKNENNLLTETIKSMKKEFNSQVVRSALINSKEFMNKLEQYGQHFSTLKNNQKELFLKYLNAYFEQQNFYFSQFHQDENETIKKYFQEIKLISEKGEEKIQKQFLKIQKKIQPNYTEYCQILEFFFEK